jgi:uncharacterized protein (TIGR02145 family)
MNRKISTLLLFLLFAGTAFAQSEVAERSRSTEDEGVIINGVKWATRNVDAPGTFAPQPESAGKFYQWNRKKPYNTTDIEVLDWDKTIPEGTSWEAINDPCPTGWRVPTVDEIKSLFDKENVTNEWVTTSKGVSGRMFTDKESGNSLFLPAAGYRIGGNGTLRYAGRYGNYWGRTLNESNFAYYLYFVSTSSAWYYSFYRGNARTLRPVAE